MYNLDAANVNPQRYRLAAFPEKKFRRSFIVCNLYLCKL